MRNRKIDITKTAMQKVFKQRTFMIIAGLALLFVTYYGYGITGKRVNVLNNGTIVKAPITRMTSKGTYFVSIENREYDAGDHIPGRTSVSVGDTVSVYSNWGLSMLCLWAKRLICQ